MNADGPELRDIHLPVDPSWWPPAPGWWLLILVVLILIAMAVVQLRKRIRNQRWKQRVMWELDAIAVGHQREPDGVRLASELSQLLRRASRLIDPFAPALRGEAWLRFLDTTLGGTDFSSGTGRVLLDGPYQRATSFDPEALLALTRSWLVRVLVERDRHV